MSEQYFLEKCIISAEDAKGGYSSMARLDLDPTTNKMYKDMETDATKHLHALKNRLNYLKQKSNSQN